MSKLWIYCFLLVLVSGASFLLGHFYTSTNPLPQVTSLLQPSPTPKPLPLLQYTIAQLSAKSQTANSPIQITKLIEHDPSTQLSTMLFTYQSQGRTISGALTAKINPSTDATASPRPVVVMLRGYAPLESYYSGMGTQRAANALATAGYITLAPDFLGYGASDPELSDTWEARFVKPLQVLDLIKSIETFPQLTLDQILDASGAAIQLNPEQMGVWAHSNGGQIAVTTLEILGQNLPTTLWAPVLAPFPYSILYFSDEYQDEGKETRKYISLFEDDYDVFDFSLTKHLDRLHGPIQIHHGGRDDSALLSWSEEFLDKVDLENQRRATTSALTEKLTIELHRYPNADHNLQPNWQQVMQRDLDFFATHLLDK